MDNVTVLSKFKESLGSVIENFRNKINEIELKEDFLQLLSDLVNYSRSDALLLPFYDESILSKVFEVVFPIYDTQMNKLKTAKYLIESSKDIDINHFPQYNDSVNDLIEINNKIVEFYDNLLSSNTYSYDKDNYNSMINKYSSIYDLIGDESFSGFISDIDLFHDVLYDCELSLDELNFILNIAIKCNLFFLGNNDLLDVQVDVFDNLNDENMDVSDLTYGNL